MNSRRIYSTNNENYVHLKITDLTQSLDFYIDLLGFKIELMYEEHKAAHLSTGNYHYLFASDTWFAQH